MLYQKVQELILKSGVLFKSLLVVLILMKKVWTSDINTVAKTLDLSLASILTSILNWLEYLEQKCGKSRGYRLY
jgi:hypothetical protein